MGELGSVSSQISTLIRHSLSSREFSPPGSRKGVTIGLPSYMDGWNLRQIFDAISKEELEDESHIEEIIVVTSTPSDGTLPSIQYGSSKGLPIRLVTEPSRSGKSTAINTIRELASGDIIVFLNSDSIFTPGSLRRLVSTLVRNGNCVVGARPLPIRTNEGVTCLSKLIWDVHHRMLESGPVLHASGEMMAIPRNLLTKIPPDIINDDAYISQMVRTQGWRIIYDPTAIVLTNPAPTIFELFQQRSRIVEGHLQLMIRYGWRPVGIFFSAVQRPKSLDRIIKAVSRPRDIAFLITLAVLEVMAFVSAVLRIFTRRRPTFIWPRYLRNVVTLK